MSGTHVDFSGTTNQKWQNYHNAASNAAISAAYRVRTNGTLPAAVFVVGLGGNATYTPDYTLLQRMANDPNGDGFNSPALYDPCVTQPKC